MSSDAPITPLSSLVKRFTTMPRRSDETWQGAIVPLPFFAPLVGPGSVPERERLVVWVNLATGAAALADVTPAESAAETFVRSFLELGLRDRKSREGRPSQIEVNDPTLGDAIKTALKDDALQVVLKPALDQVDVEAKAFLKESIRHDVPPGLLEGQGVTIERVRAFAAAAAAFYRRHLWDDLTIEDFLQIDSPGAQTGMGGCSLDSLDGSILFYESREEFEAIHGVDDEFDDDVDSEGENTDVIPFGDEDDVDVDPEDDEDDDLEDEDDVDDTDTEDDVPEWSIDFMTIQGMLPWDLDMWENGNLPVAAPTAYPRFQGARIGAAGEPIDSGRLAFAEGLLRALAETTESDLDSGRWTKRVVTADGPVDFALSLPLLLEDIADPDRDARLTGVGMMARFLDEHASATPEEAIDLLEQAKEEGRLGTVVTPSPDRALELAYRATGAPGRRRLQLVREALAIAPDCALALIHRATNIHDPQRSIEAWQKALNAAEAALAGRAVPLHVVARADALPDEEDEHSSVYLTPPYRRVAEARIGLARTLRDIGRLADAAEQYRAVLDIDPHADPFDVLYALVAVLLEAGSDREAGGLLLEYDDDRPDWVYAWLLIDFRHRTPADARERLREALAVNSRVAHLLAHMDRGASGTGLDDEDEHDVDSWDYDEENDPSVDATICVNRFATAWEMTPGALEWLRVELHRIEQEDARRSRRRDRRRRGGRGRRG